MSPATIWRPNVEELSRHFRTYAVDSVGEPNKTVAFESRFTHAQCATIAELFVHGDLVGRIGFPHGLGLGISGLLVLTSMAVFVVAGIGRLTAARWGDKQSPKEPRNH